MSRKRGRVVEIGLLNYRLEAGKRKHSEDAMLSGREMKLTEAGCWWRVNLERGVDPII